MSLQPTSTATLDTPSLDMSRSGTLSPGTNTGTLPSPSRTAVDLHQHGLQHAENKWIDAEEAAFKKVAEAQAEKDGPRGAEIKLSQKRKWFLLFIFSVAQYLDVASYSGLVCDLLSMTPPKADVQFVFTEPMLRDLDIKYEESSWIIVSSRSRR